MAGAVVVNGFKLRVGAAELVAVELPKVNGATEAVVVVEASPKPNPVLAGCVAVEEGAENPSDGVAEGAEKPSVAVVVVAAGAPNANPPVAGWAAAAGCAVTDSGWTVLVGRLVCGVPKVVVCAPKAGGCCC